MHEQPKIPHFRVETKKWNAEKKQYEDIPYPEVRLSAGQVICLEPMLTYKDETGYIGPDGWTVRTRDGKNSAFFEHMVEVLPEGYQILTNHFNEGGDTV